MNGVALGNTAAGIRLAADLAKGEELRPLQGFCKLAGAGFGALRRWAVKGHPAGGYLDAVYVGTRYHTTPAAVKRLRRAVAAARRIERQATGAS